MKKKLSVLASLCLTLSTTVSAGASAADLRISWWGADARHVATQKAAQLCAAKYGHKISSEFGGFGGHQEKVTTQLAGGTEPDIMQINWPWLPLMSKNGTGFADLATLPQLDTSKWPAAILEDGKRAGKLNGLPVSTTGRVFFVNKTAFEKAGLKVPTSWKELIDSTKAFKAANGPDSFPFFATGLDALLVVSLAVTQKTGKDLIDGSTNKVAWTAQQLTDGLNFYQSLVDTGTIQRWKDAVGSGSVNLFERGDWIAGKIGATYQWDSTYTQYAGPLAKGNELVPVPLLKVDGAVTDGVYRKPSMVWSISARTPNKTAAAQVLNCLVNEPEAVAIMGIQRGLPANSNAADQLLTSGGIEKVLVVANDMVVKASGPVASPFNEHPEVRDIFQNTLEEFAYGKLTATAAATAIINGINGVLAKL